MDIRWNYACDGCGMGFQVILGDIRVPPTDPGSPPQPCPICARLAQEITLTEYIDRFGDGCDGVRREPGCDTPGRL